MPPSRHNAILHITFDDGEPLHLFLTGYGSPDSVKSLLKLSIRGIRGTVAADPEEIAINLFWYAKKKTSVYIRRRDLRYAFTYHIRLGKNPQIRIKSNSADDSFNLFQFVGYARAISEKPKAQSDYVKTGKRGRPSGLSKFYVPAPDYITPDGEAIYHNKKAEK